MFVLNICHCTYMYIIPMIAIITALQINNVLHFQKMTKKRLFSSSRKPSTYKGDIKRIKLNVSNDSDTTVPYSNDEDTQTCDIDSATDTNYHNYDSDAGDNDEPMLDNSAHAEGDSMNHCYIYIPFW